MSDLEDWRLREECRSEKYLECVKFIEKLINTIYNETNLNEFILNQRRSNLQSLAQNIYITLLMDKEQILFYKGKEKIPITYWLHHLEKIFFNDFGEVTEKYFYQYLNFLVEEI